MQPSSLACTYREREGKRTTTRRGEKKKTKRKRQRGVKVSEAALENISRSTSSTYADIRIPLVSYPRSLLFLFAPHSCRRFFLLSPASILVYPSLLSAFDLSPSPWSRSTSRNLRAWFIVFNLSLISPLPTHPRKWLCTEVREKILANLFDLKWRRVSPSLVVSLVERDTRAEVIVEIHFGKIEPFPRSIKRPPP